MSYHRTTDRLSLPLIVVFVLSLLAFLPLAIPRTGGTPQPVQGYTTHGNHAPPFGSGR